MYGRNQDYEQDTHHQFSAKQNRQLQGNQLEDEPDDTTKNYSGFQCIAPSSKKREEMLQAQAKANHSYEQMKRNSQLAFVSESGTVGGNSTEVEARRRAQLQQSRSKMELRRKQEQYKAEARRKDEEESARIKAEGRRKAELLEKRQQEDYEQRQRAIQEDHRKKNEAFLRKFESRSDAQMQMSRPEEQANVLSCSRSDSLDRSCGKLELLCNTFPYYDPAMLAELLQQHGNDVDSVILLLSS